MSQAGLVVGPARPGFRCQPVAGETGVPRGPLVEVAASSWRPSGTGRPSRPLDAPRGQELPETRWDLVTGVGPDGPPAYDAKARRPDSERGRRPGSTPAPQNSRGKPGASTPTPAGRLAGSLGRLW